MNMVVTIDGPSGAGKTTVSRILAARLNYKYVDTGALYRGVAFEATSQGLDPDDDTGLAVLCENLDLKFIHINNELRLFSKSMDITDKIRTPEITMLASAISARPVVRRYLLSVQREMGREKRVVFEGRDMGTVVFPEAEVKFFLTASQKIRSLRRFKELKSDNNQTLESVERDIKRRDTNDSSRELAPLKPAEDAIHIDSTDLSIEEVVEQMLSHIDKIRK